MTQRARKLPPSPGSFTASPSLHDHDLVLADVSREGIVRRLSDIGMPRWGWSTGDLVPESILEALRRTNGGAARWLAVARDDLALAVLPQTGGWLLVGCPSDVDGPEPVSSFKSLIENAPAAVIRIAADGTVLAAEVGERFVLGQPADKLVGRPLWRDAIHPEDRWQVTEALRQSGQGRRTSVVVRFLTATQAVRTACLYFLPAAQPSEADVEALIFDVTGRAEADEAVLYSETLYRAFLEQSPLGILHLDAAGIVTFENHPFRQIIGEGADDAWIGRPLDQIHGLDTRLLSLIMAMLRNGTPVQGTPLAYRRSGDEMPLHLIVHGSPIRQPDGRIVGGVMMVQDVTLQHRREEELRLRDRYEQAELALREAVLGDLNEDVFLHEAGAVFGESSQADRIHLLQHLGDEGNCITRAVWARNEHDDLFSLFVRSGDYPALRQAVVEGTDVYLRASEVSAETQVLLELTEAEEVLWVPFYESGRLGGFVLFERILPPPKAPDGFWHVTEQHLMDHLVRLFETLWSWIQVGRRYRETVATIEDCLFTFTFSSVQARRYLFVTPQVETLTGFTAEEILARPNEHWSWIEDLVADEDRAMVADHDAVLRAGRESRITYRVVRPDGATRWVREQATPHRDVPGRVMVSGVLIDVTEQKDAEAVRHSAEEQAKSASRLKSTFVSTMSHELRTPLGAVNGFAELLALELAEWEAQTGQTLPPQLHEFTEAVRQNAARLLQLADDLFVLSNMEMGALRLDRRAVPLHPVVRRCTDKAIAQISQRDVVLETDLDVGDPTVAADPLRVTQILDHLLANAVKFTGEGRITVRTRKGADEVLVEVADTGPGIDPEYMDRLFTPFLQEDSRLNRRFGGAGLGLALVKRLLDLMDGRIEVESEKGRGATFRVFLPVR